MQYYSVWAHGNTARIESPESFQSIKNYGWGTDVIFKVAPYEHSDGYTSPSWLHIPVTTHLPIGTLERTYLLSVQILFYTQNAKIGQIDIYDGTTLIHSHHAEDELSGNRLLKADKISDVESAEKLHEGIQYFNLIRLPKPHLVYCGIGISLLAHARFTDSEKDARLLIASASANFKVVSVVEEQVIHDQIQL